MVICDPFGYRRQAVQMCELLIHLAVPGRLRVKAQIANSGSHICSGNLDLDMLGLGFLVFRQMHGEYTVLELGADLCRTGIIWQREGPSETAVGAFDPVIPLP